MFEKVFRKNSMSHVCVDFRYVRRDVPVALAPSISGQFTVFPHLPRPSCWRAVRFAGEQETRAQLRTVCQRPCRWPVTTCLELRLSRTTRPCFMRLGCRYLSW